MDRVRFGFFNEFNNEPTLLFFGSRHGLHALIDILLSLNDAETILLSHDSRFISLGGTEVAISITEETQGEVSCQSFGRYLIKWIAPKKDLAAFIEKIKSVADSTHPCHQYLDGQLGGVTVMISTGEYPDTLYPEPPQSPSARFKYFRERAGLSMGEVAEKMGGGFIDMGVWDIEAYDDELFSVYSPRQVLRLSQIINTTPQELMNLHSSEPPVTATELVQFTNRVCVTRGISLDQLEDKVGWHLSRMIEPPELLLQDMSLEGIIDLCKELQIDWVRVIDGMTLDASDHTKTI